MTACRNLDCNRPAVHWRWFEPIHSLASHLIAPTCSPTRLLILKDRNTMLSDPTPVEIAAMKYAGEQGGEYLDSISKTDLASLTSDEWSTFIGCVCGGYVTHILNTRSDAVESAARMTPCPF